MYQNLQDAAKPVFRGKLIQLVSILEKKNDLNNLRINFKKMEKEEHMSVK